MRIASTPWLLALVLTSCIAAAPGAATSPPPLHNTEPPGATMDAEPVDAEGVVGTWVGTYVCPQGQTGLTLTVEQLDGDMVRAVFSFYAVASNPLVPNGRFSMSGTLERDGRLALRAGDWIDRPPGFVTVDLVGQVSRDGAYFSGRVEDRQGACSTFSVRRASM